MCISHSCPIPSESAKGLYSTVNQGSSLRAFFSSALFQVLGVAKHLMFLSPQQVCGEALIPNMMVFGGGASGR